MHYKTSVVLFALSVFLAPSCSSSPDKTVLSKSALPRTTPQERLDCGSGFTAKYSAQSQSMPATVDVTYRGKQPTSASMEAALRHCMETAIATRKVTGDLLAQVWWSEKGTEDDDSVQYLTDGSLHLFVGEGTTQVISLKQKDGEVTTVYDRRGYFVEHTRLKRLVAPRDTYYHVDLVFNAPTSEKIAYQTLIGEMKRLLGEQKPPLETMGAALVGTKANPAGRRQIGLPGHYVYVEYEPKRHGKQLVDGDGRSLGPEAVINQ